jgi:error-prone DNA polymerase
MSALALAGALRSLSVNRRSALYQAHVPRTPGLFAEVPLGERALELVSETPAEQLVMDYAHKGLSVGDHPLRYYRKKLKKLGVSLASDLLYLSRGAKVQVAGLVMNRQRPGTASGTVFMTLEDESGFANLVLSAECFEAFYHVAVSSPMLIAYGTVERDTKIPVPLPGTPEEKAPKTSIMIQVLSLERLSKETVSRRSLTSAEKERSAGETQALMRLSRNFH